LYVGYVDSESRSSLRNLMIGLCHSRTPLRKNNDGTL
jgi:hypothetical protein